MLTRDLALAEYRDWKLIPDRLTRARHGGYIEYAQQMLDIYRSGVGRTRRELHMAAREIFADEEDCPPRRIDAFCKLLDDVSVYDKDSRGRAAALRRTVFRAAAPEHPLVRKVDRLFEHNESEVKQRIAQGLGRSWEEIDRDLFADVMEFHRLKSFEGYPDAAALLARYNVAQVQVALFGAVSMVVWASDDFKDILRYAKLARLMHTIELAGQGHYCFRFNGPASLLRQTRRYGVAMARFLPALVACHVWKMRAEIRTRRAGRTIWLDLSSDDGLNSHLPPPEEFDSSVERTFAEKWGTEKRDGWQLIREGEVLHRGQKVFIPDNLFRHDDGRTVLMEIVGFWTPEYIEAKLQTLRAFDDRRILLAVSKSAGQQMGELPRGTIVFGSKLSIKDVLAALKTDFNQTAKPHTS